MSAINEFTGVGGIPAVTAGAQITNTLPKKKKKRAIDEFLEMTVQEASPMETTPPAVTPAAPAATPAVTAEEKKEPVASVTTEAAVSSSLMISKEVLEALNNGYSTVVRGILLEPMVSRVQKMMTEKKTAPADDSIAARMGQKIVEDAGSVAASVVESVTGGGVDMSAAQPPPQPPGDGKAVMSAFRRFGIN